MKRGVLGLASTYEFCRTVCVQTTSRKDVVALVDCMQDSLDQIREAHPAAAVCLPSAEQEHKRHRLRLARDFLCSLDNGRFTIAKDKILDQLDNEVASWDGRVGAIDFRTIH